MEEIYIVKRQNDEVIEEKNIKDVGALFEANREVIERLYDLLSMFLHPNDAGNFKFIMDELQRYDRIKIEMYKE